VTDDAKKQEMGDLFIANRIIAEKPVFLIQIELCRYVTRKAVNLFEVNISGDIELRQKGKRW
jgi:hypothetical protein